MRAPDITSFPTPPPPVHRESPLASRRTVTARDLRADPGPGAFRPPSETASSMGTFPTGPSVSGPVIPAHQGAGQLPCSSTPSTLRRSSPATPTWRAVDRIVGKQRSLDPPHAARQPQRDSHRRRPTTRSCAGSRWSTRRVARSGRPVTGRPGCGEVHRQLLGRRSWAARKTFCAAQGLGLSGAFRQQSVCPRQYAW